MILAVFLILFVASYQGNNLAGALNWTAFCLLVYVSIRSCITLLCAIPPTPPYEEERK